MTLIIIALDGTLVSDPLGRTPKTLADQFLMPGVAERCEFLRSQGHTLAVVAGTPDDSSGDGLIRRAESAARMVAADGYEVFRWTPKNRGLLYANALENLIRRYSTDRADTIFVGDEVSDHPAAVAAGLIFRVGVDFFFR
jgi:phosphoglycolate phosphatase-like HAD superfamily hydrolase